MFVSTIVLLSFFGYKVIIILEKVIDKGKIVEKQ